MSDMSQIHAMLSASYNLSSGVADKRLATSAAGLRITAAAVTPATTNAKLFEVFSTDVNQANMAVVENDRPIGLINKNVFMEAFARPFARELFGKVSCTKWMSQDALIVEESTPVETLTRLAVNTGERVLKDGFITTVDGRYSGIGTGFALMQAMSDLEAEKTRQMLASIQYASSIQQAHLRTSYEHLPLAFADQSMLWKPRDVVGGDCFFVRRLAEGTLVAVVDCTGHGVPGAFMTLIALSWLEQTAPSVDDRVDPGQLLAGLNRYIKGVLNQKADGASMLAQAAVTADDGMDVAMLWQPHGTHSLRFASAKLTLMTTEPGSGEVHHIEGEKVGVGYASTPEDFVWASHSLSFDRETRCIVVTDGIIDQLGGTKKIALGKKRTTQFFNEHSTQPAAEICPKLYDYLLTWQGNNSRRDDVTAFAFTLGA